MKNTPVAAIKVGKKENNNDGLFDTKIEAILLHVYNVIMRGKSKLRKPDYVKNLAEEMTKNIAKYKLFLSSARTAIETNAAITVIETTTTNTNVTVTTVAITLTETTAAHTTATATTLANSCQS